MATRKSVLCTFDFELKLLDVSLMISELETQENEYFNKYKIYLHSEVSYVHKIGRVGQKQTAGHLSNLSCP